MILHYRIFILPATPLRWDLRALGFAHCEFVYASSSSSANVCHYNYHTEDFQNSMSSQLYIAAANP
jgi:hypothetical protein